MLVSNRKILITGILGFTGMHLAKALADLGGVVHGISRTIDAAYGTAYIVHECDIKDLDSIKKVALDVQPEYVFHLAGDASNVGSAIDKYNANIIGTENILKAIIETNCPVRKVIIASSASVYGDSQQECRETFSPEPVSHYGISKLGAEKIAQYYFNQIPIVITRPFNYTGPGQDERFLIPKIIKHFKLKKATIELGNINVLREFNSIEYIVDIYIKLMSSEVRDSVVNLCSGKTYSISQILAILETITNHTIDVLINEDYVRKNEISELRGSIEKLQTYIELNTEKNNLRKTMKQMLKNDK